MPQRVAEESASTPTPFAWIEDFQTDRRNEFMTAPGRMVPLGSQAGEVNFYLVRTGLCLLEYDAGDARRRILKILCPGDVLQLAALPPLPELRLVAAQPSHILKLTSEVTSSPHLSARIFKQLAKSERRTYFLLNAIGVLKAEARVAGLFIELALRLNCRPGDHSGFQMPLSRRDIADHLALNADTLSRILSRFKADGVCHQSGRDRIFIKDWHALLAHCPIADALIADLAT